MDLNNSLHTNHYDYSLPENRIRKYPIEQRDASKLLFYKKGKIQHHTFKQIDSLIPSGSCLVFNDTKVIPARLYFKKDTGALIELFLLEPQAPTSIVSEAMLVKKTITWRCMIGNLKKWKDSPLTLTVVGNEHTFEIQAKLLDRQKGLVAFSWGLDIAFVDVVTAIGEIPLPPYFKREAESTDVQRYQTVYSEKEGAVAAPTAGLHFTNAVLEALKQNQIHLENTTLHVSAGTFQPVKADNITEHKMHGEQIVVSRKNIENFLAHQGKLFAVGTTSMRTLESLFWFGVQRIKQPDNALFHIDQNYAYTFDKNEIPSFTDAMTAILAFMDQQNLTVLQGTTEIFIRPGYTLRSCTGLITNFHMPKSTLLMLIAALVGPNWKTIYQQALENDYYFLSYGDSSLIIP